MSYCNGPRIITESLAFYVDAGNKKSYPSSGSIWYDLSKSNNHATYVNNGYPAITWNPSGYFDYSANNPTSGNAYAGNGFLPAKLPTQTSNGFTLESFIKRHPTIPTVGDRETIFSNAGGADGFRFQVANNGLLIALIGGSGGIGYTEGSIGGGYNLLDNKWHMVSLVFDRAGILGSYSILGYVDGVFIGALSIPSNNAAFSSSSAGIGYLGCCTVFGGKIAMVRVYNKLLSASEVYLNYIATANRYTNL